MLRVVVFIIMIQLTGAAYAKLKLCSVCFATNLSAETAVVTAAWAALQAKVASMFNTRTIVLGNALRSVSSQSQADKEHQNTFNKTLAEAQLDAENQYKLQEHSEEVGRMSARPEESCKTMEIVAAAHSAENVAANEAVSRSSKILKLNMFTESQPNAVNNNQAAHNREFCSTDDMARGRCQAVSADMQDMDMHVDTFMNPDESGTLGSAEKSAANAFIAGVINPLPTQALPAQWEKTQQGKAYVFTQMQEQRTLGLAGFAMSSIAASRTGPDN